MLIRKPTEFEPFFRLLAGFAMGLLLSVAGAADASNTDPQPQIEQTTHQLLLELREKSKEIGENRQVAYDLGDKFIVPYLDFPTITRLVIGKYWRSATEQQKKRLIEEIRELIIRSYVTAMSSYADQIVATGDKITYFPSRFRPGDKKAVVRANIELQDNRVIDVDYMLFDGNDQWKIYDIRVAGVSLAVTYRTSYGVEIARVGLDGLIDKLSKANSSDTVEFPGVPDELRNVGSK
jgi:phospholipid transport system substrate-binding protein